MIQRKYAAIDLFERRICECVSVIEFVEFFFVAFEIKWFTGTPSQKLFLPSKLPRDMNLNHETRAYFSRQ